MIQFQTPPKRYQRTYQATDEAKKEEIGFLGPDHDGPAAQYTKRITTDYADVTLFISNFKRLLQGDGVDAITSYLISSRI